MDDYQIFDGDGFRRLFEEADLENLDSLSNQLPAITEDRQIDERMRQIAIERGYHRRPMPTDVSKLVLVEGDRHRLQPKAAKAYLDLKDAAMAAGLRISLTSAYRDYDYQRPLFLRKLASNYADDHVFECLKAVAIPGYSKHHTGYTVDLAEGEYILEKFTESESYKWLTADNFKNAKRHGWIPSYPPDAEKQGPDPEPWEFVYVGQKYLETNNP